MSRKPILLMGGSGAIGRLSATSLRRRYPDVPLLIAGRDLPKAEALADELGTAEAVSLDVDADDLGLGDRSVDAVAVFYHDTRQAGLRYARARGLPHLSISSGIFEMAPDIALFMQEPKAGAMVLGYEWLVGATTLPALQLAASFQRIDRISIGALVDEEDQGGPAVADDFARLARLMPGALTRRGSSAIWREGPEMAATFRAIDGTVIAASGFSSVDVAGLAAATGAGDVSFDLATAISSSRRSGGPLSTEIIIGIAGLDLDGQARRSRHAVFHPGGAAPLTALGVTMILERLTGLDGHAPTAPGLYFPYQVLDHAAYLSRLEVEGGAVIGLELD
ncbi:NAD(P)-dependent oxidoreductase [Rhizobium sp. YIM 134829]|uniref:NAD(P)-dependent oxidoreductase n=1 Tax=Rhizobium sp. YIM 134829 TaxID=3390453 RepID=UPI00397D0A74